MSDDIPAEWRAHLERKGLASYRRLGDAAQISHEAARRVVTGQGVRASTVAAVARAMGVDVEVIHELRQESPTRAQVWEPPASASLLTQDERDALNRLVNLMTAGRRHEELMGNAEHPAPIGAAPIGVVHTSVTPPQTRPVAASRTPDEEPPRAGRRGSGRRAGR